MRNATLSIEEQSPEDYTEQNPEYNNENHYWILVHYTRDINGNAGIELFLDEELSVAEYERYKETDYITVETLTDMELVKRIKGDSRANDR